MNNHTYNKTILTTSLLLLMTGLFGSTAGATPACDPHNSPETNTIESTSNVDRASEPTDSLDVEITDLPDKINRVLDKLETASDVKYYSFAALRGQKVMINDVQRGADGSYWKIEYNITGKWHLLPTLEPLITPSLDIGQKVKIRISHPTRVPIQPNRHFHLDFGSAPYAHDIRIETEGPTTGTYFSTKTFRNRILLLANIRDSKGHYLEGATVNFVINPDEQNPSSSVNSQSVTTTGGVVQYVDFPRCIGRHTTAPFQESGSKTKWRVTYNTGHWYVSVRGNPNTGISPVSITQICTIDLVR